MYHLILKNINKKYGGVNALNSVSLKFEIGKITSIIGPNGSGKSTLINTITGFTNIDSGQLIIEEKANKGLNKNEIVGMGIVRTFQNSRLFNQMSVLENILINFSTNNVIKSVFEIMNDSHIKKSEQILEKIGLLDKKDCLVEELSFGQKKLLELGRVLAIVENNKNNIKTILLDEPFSGVSGPNKDKIFSFLSFLKNKKIAIVLVEHDMIIIKKLSDYLYVLDAGKVIDEGVNFDDIFMNKKVIDAYLGI